MFKKIATQFVIILLILGIGTPVISSATLAANSATLNPKLENFDVNKYLKIPDGQTYLDQKSESDLKSNTPNLKNGVVYFIIKFIELLTKIIGSFALLFLIAGGLTLMLSHGNSQLQTKGKQMILYSLLGVVVAFGSLIIVTFVQSLFFTT